MGRRRRKQKRSKARKFQELSSQRTVDNFLVSEEQKLEQSAHQKRVCDLENRILSKTIFVSSVKDLNNEHNLQTLRSFFERNYGPVKSCHRARFTGKSRRGGRSYPRARVQFRDATDVGKIFGVDSLLKVSRSSSREINCDVGYNGFIKVQRSQKFDGMLDSDSIATVLELNSFELAIGHWFGSEDEMWAAGDDVRHVDDDWLEESKIGGDFDITIDLKERKVEIKTKLTENRKNSSVDDVFQLEDLAILSSLVGLSIAPAQTGILSFRFKQLLHPMQICQTLPSEQEACCLIFPLKYSPKLEKEDDNERRSRCLQFGGMKASQFGDCTALRLRITKHTLLHLTTNMLVFEKLKKFGIVKREFHSMQDVGRVQVSQIGTHNASCFKQEMVAMSKFGIDLLIRSLVDSGKFCWYHSLRDPGSPQSLFQLVEDCIIQNGKSCAEGALLRIFHASGRTRYPCTLFSELIEPAPASVPTLPTLPTLPAYLVPIFGLHLTLCRQALQGYSEEVSNRLVRKLLAVPGFTPASFLRVEIAEEDGLKLFGANLSTDVATYFQGVLASGIQLNGRLYQFLAFSMSQLKSNSFWMVSTPEEWTVTKIRSQLGDFSRCPTASIYAARVGQCLSTTFEAQKCTAVARSVQVGSIQDFLAVNGSEHSDGTGLISEFAMRELIEDIPFGRQNSADVSIIQVRIGGAKGTLTSWDFGTLPHARAHRSQEVLLRPSMIKFHADYSSIEVCKVGSRTTYHLNRYIILLLVTQGVPNETVIHMQQEIVDDICMMLNSREKAMDLLNFLPGPDSKERKIMLRMLKYGLEPSREPFLFACLVSMLLYNIQQLRKKSRIPVRQGAVVMGGLDETGLIPEGCVFLEVQKRGEAQSSGNFEPIIGPVMVTKHPALHPGDLRMLLAVDIKELRGHRHVLLFSRHGERPETHKMAGSDLDGDEYAITWDARLFLNEWNGALQLQAGTTYLLKSGRSIDVRDDITQAVRSLKNATHDPMIYDEETDSTTLPRELSSNEEEHTGQLIDHLLNCIKNDNLGRICTMWLDYAAKFGASSSQCLQLAKLASIAVDFPKKGIPAEVPDGLVIKSIEPRPHWREHRRSESYHCECTIGRLYDDLINRTGRVSEHTAPAEAGRRRDKYGQITYRVDDRHTTNPLVELYEESIPFVLGFLELSSNSRDRMQLVANEERVAFEERVLEIINKFNIRSEGELFTQCILKYSKAHKKKQFTFAKEVHRQMISIREEFQQSFYTFVLEFSDDRRSPEETSLSDMVPEYSDDEVGWAFKVCTSYETDWDENDLRVTDMRRISRQLAAAYYMSSYAPDLQWTGGNQTKLRLFMFPWIVVADLLPL